MNRHQECPMALGASGSGRPAASGDGDTPEVGIILWAERLFSVPTLEGEPLDGYLERAPR